MVSWSILSHSSGRHKRLLLPHALRAASMSVGARACVLLLILVLLLYPAQTQQTNLSSSNDSCLANDGYGMQACLANASSNRILLKQPVYMNLTTSPAEQGPIIINRSIVISSEASGPRMLWDCGLLSNRFQLQPNLTLTLQHLIITNCSSSKPLSFIRLSSGTAAIVNDSFIVQSDGLCLDPATAAQVAAAGAAGPGALAAADQNPAAAAGQNPAPAAAAAAGLGLGPPGAWCVNSTVSNNASINGMSQQGSPYYVDPAWPGSGLCNESAMLFRTYQAVDPHGWVSGTATDADSNNSSSNGSSNSTAKGAGTRAAVPLSLSLPQQQQQQQQGLYFGSDTDLIYGSYTGFYTLQGINSALLCPKPLDPIVCANLPGAKDPASCLSAAYERVNPDRQLAPGAAEYLYAAAGVDVSGQRQQEEGDGNRGVKVVLLAALVSVVGAAGLAATLGVLFLRHRRQQLHKPPSADGTDTICYRIALATTADTDPQMLPSAAAAAGRHHTSWFGNWGSAGVRGTGSPGDPTSQLLGLNNFTPGTGSSGRSSSAAGSSASSAPDGISLSVLLGAGSFGGVYAGTWNGKMVAVKVITHSSLDNARIEQELSLSLSFNHPNLVRALHYAKVEIKPHRGSRLGEPASPGSELTTLFLPQGAVGVFTLPKDWAITQRVTQPVPDIDAEAWIVMDLMDCGNLAVAIRHRDLFKNQDDSLNMACLLRRAADVAAGIAYLHSRSVCHGDLKCENVLLKSEARDPDGLMAKVADFGLSRALQGQSHLSTKRYGTVTHMPPELLVSGKLTPAVDVYSFGIMMWEFVSAAVPFSGMHHGVIIHSVVTQDLRPGPWPTAAQQQLPAAYIPLAEACWARRASKRPKMSEVLQEILLMLAEVQGEEAV